MDKNCVNANQHHHSANGGKAYTLNTVMIHNTNEFTIQTMTCDYMCTW